MKPKVLLVASFIPASQTASLGSMLGFEAWGLTAGIPKSSTSLHRRWSGWHHAQRESPWSVGRSQRWLPWATREPGEGILSPSLRTCRPPSSTEESVSKHRDLVLLAPTVGWIAKGLGQKGSLAIMWLSSGRLLFCSSSLRSPVGVGRWELPEQPENIVLERVRVFCCVS